MTAENTRAPADVVRGLREARVYRDAGGWFGRSSASMENVCGQAIRAAAFGATRPDAAEVQALGATVAPGRAVITLAPYDARNPVASMLVEIDVAGVAEMLGRAREAIDRQRAVGTEIVLGFGAWWTTDNAEQVPLWCAPSWWLEDLWGWLEEQMRRPAPPVGDEPPLPWPAVWTAAITRELGRRRAAPPPEFVLW